MKKYIVLVVLGFSAIAFGAEAQATPAEWLQRLISLIPTDGSTIAMIGLALEFILRLVPSAKPLSVLYWIADFCRHGAELMIAIAEFLDKVLGQKLMATKPNYNPPGLPKR
jgi:hypothetical protein